MWKAQHNARIPIAKLSHFHLQIKNKIVYVNEGYFQFYKAYLKKLLSARTKASNDGSVDITLTRN